MSQAGDAPTPRSSGPYDETVKATPTPGGGKTPQTRRTPSTPTLPAEVADAPASSRFGKFVRTKRLGAGGMGEVWKAWDTQLERWVALKFLMSGDEEEIARFRREAQTAGRLHHPNIAAIYEVDEDQGRHYIAMQYVEGHTLKTFPRNDRKVLVKVLAEAAQAVQHAHDQGVVHRDLKPENVMVASRQKAGREEHHVYVMDFGLARVAEGASNFSVSGLVVGTPAYMAPEQARGERVDSRADVYSLGVTLYELLTDRRPFQGSNVLEILKLAQEAEPKPLRKIDPAIPADLETIVLKCMAKEPSGRYASAHGLAEDLLAFNAGEPIHARPEGFSRKMWRRVRRNPLAVAAGAVVLAAVAVTATVVPGARRDRQVANLLQKIEGELAQGNWPAGEALIERLAEHSPEEARLARDRRKRAVVESFRRWLQAGDRPRAKAVLDFLATVDSEEATRLEKEYRLREASWPAVFTLESPFSDATVFDKGRVRTEGELLRPAPGAPGVILTRKPCEGKVELKAEFDGAWEAGTQIGLVLNGSSQGGYAFLLATADPAARTPAAPAVPFREVRKGQGELFLAIKRHQVVLRVEPVPASRFTPGLRLLARREGDRLTLQANDLKPVEFQDPFPLVGGRSVFGVVWPAGVGVRRLQASRQELPAVASPLERGDDRFVQGHYDQALERYREAGLGSSLPAVRLEARYKEALCHFQSNREAEARKLWEEVAAQFIKGGSEEELRWAFLADCQLLVSLFREKGSIEKAAAILDKLPGYGYDFEKLARLIPQDVQRPLLDNSFTGGTVGNLHRKPEEAVAVLEFGVKASEILEPRPGPYWKPFGLVRAYRMAGRELDALRWTEKIFREFGYRGDAVDEACWILRLRGENAKALEVVNRGVAQDPGRKVERARVYAGLGQWEKAEGEIDAYRPETYFDRSGASLLEGFLAERRGNEAAAQEAWRRGLRKNWTPRSGPKEDEGNGTPILHNWIMASLTNDMTDADAEQMFSALLTFAGRDNPIFNRLLRPSMLRETWRTPRAREIARKVALRNLPLRDWALHPMFLGWMAFLHEIAFPPGPLSPGQDDLLWQFAADFYGAFLEGQISEKHFLPLGVILQGNPNSPGMGWREMGVILAKVPHVRGPLAYVLGHRYLKRGEKDFARAFFRQAEADSEGNPLLRRLAEAEAAPLK